jgi:phospholipid/cholesterol/gamma-HCH transport system substrate-binding protein
MHHLEGILRPDGKMMKNVQASMESMKNTMAAAEAVMNKIKEGEGSVGKFINDPSLYDDIRAAIQSVNLLLGKAGLLRTYVDIGAWKIPMYDGSRGYFKVQIAPNPTRYYLIGISNDPRGRNARTTTTTTTNGGTPTVVVEDKNTEKGLAITAMFGKYFGPLDLSVGLLEDNGAIGAGYWFDPARRYGIHVDVYSLGTGKPITERVWAKATLYSSFYVQAGIDQWGKYTGLVGGKTKTDWTYFAGAGFYFDDDDLKYLLAFK